MSRKRTKKAGAKRRAKKCKLSIKQIADMTCRKRGASMAELTAAAGIDAHQMRAKVHNAKKNLKYKIKRKGGRYYGTAPKARKKRA